jgi:hypothetical protein
MAVLLPPTPVGVPPGHSFWNDWYEKLRTVINQGNVSVLWGNINFSGSNITSIASRAHNNLQSIQGGAAGEYNHLTNTQFTRATAVIQATADPTTAVIGTNQWAIYKNTTSGQVRLWVNDNGVMRSVQLT